MIYIWVCIIVHRHTFDLIHVYIYLDTDELEEFQGCQREAVLFWESQVNSMNSLLTFELTTLDGSLHILLTELQVPHLHLSITYILYTTYHIPIQSGIHACR